MTGTGKTFERVDETGSDFVDSLISTFAWSGGSVTYAFPTSATSYDYNVGRDFEPVSQQQKNAALFAMDTSYGNKANNAFSVEGFTNLTFKAGGNDSATLRFSVREGLDNAYALDYPSNSVDSGDMVFGTRLESVLPNADGPVDLRTASSTGDFGWHVMFHELGHALGLKHPNLSDGTDNNTKMPLAKQSLEYSMMSRRTYQGDDVSDYEYEDFNAPQTYMMADIAALQHMYGADYSTNRGNTVYTWSPEDGETRINGAVAIDPTANRIFATIWDGGGADTYDLSAYDTDLSIDLRPGAYSVFDDAQLADLGGGPNDGFARGNVFNALLFRGNEASLIENAKGGTGDDVIDGNLGDNRLYGGAGADRLYGLNGEDRLFGGKGRDRLDGGKGDDVLDGYGDGLRDALRGGGGKDTFVFVKGAGGDVILDFQEGIDHLNLRAFNLSFNRLRSKIDDVGKNVEIDLGNGDVILVKNVDMSDLGSGDFLL